MITNALSKPQCRGRFLALVARGRITSCGCGGFFLTGAFFFAGGFFAGAAFGAGAILAAGAGGAVVFGVVALVVSAIGYYSCS